MVSNMNLLKTISLPELTNWSVRYLLDFTFNYNENFELVSIGEFLTRNRNIINIQDEVIYSRVTVRGNNNGVCLRDTEIGKNIGTKKQYLVNRGQFIISKIDARNGALGIIPHDLDGAIVTNDFPTFFVDNSRINSHFLLLITTTKTFIKFAQSCSSGTTNRQRINIEQFLNIKIPLPSLEEQDKIVSQYNIKIALAEKQKNKAEEFETEIENYLFEVLEIERLEKKENKKGLYLASFSELERWDYWISNLGAKSQKYPNKVLKDVVLGKPIYGANVKGVKKQSKTRYIRITDINEGGYLNDEFVSPERVDEKYLLKENDFLIARSGNTVGKTLLYKESYGRAIYAGYLVKYNIDFSIIIPEYLFLFTKSYIFKEWIKSNQRISGQPNINGQEFLQSPLVLPPIKVQKKISTHITLLKKKIRRLKIDAKENKKNALKEFEQEIFKPV